MIAHPVGHSLSPVMHNAAFAALGLSARYEALDVRPEDLPAAVAALRGPDVLGANFSVPHKEAVAKLVDELTDEARALRAVNTVVNRGGTLLGANTDPYGFAQALRVVLPRPISPRAGKPRPVVPLAPASLVQEGTSGEVAPACGRRALVLGAGGAARSVVWTLLEQGWETHVVNRDEARARALAAALGSGGGVEVVERTGLSMGGYGLVVNTTSVGMAGGPDPGGLPLVTMEQLGELPPACAVLDLVYRPATTPLLAAAERLGLKHDNGVAMLVSQGARALELWTGKRAPSGVMRGAVDEALARG